MLSSTDYDKLQQIMQENPENEALINRLLTSHQMEISTISHEIRNPLTLQYTPAYRITTSGSPYIFPLDGTASGYRIHEISPGGSVFLQ